jgi:hypothetical protein
MVAGRANYRAKTMLVVGVSHCCAMDEGEGERDEPITMYS